MRSGTAAEVFDGIGAVADLLALQSSVASRMNSPVIGSTSFIGDDDGGS